MSGICYVNGSYCAAAEARISIFDRGLLFGEAVYEVVRVHNGRVFRLRDHYARMSRGLLALEIPMPLTMENCGELFNELIRRNGIASGSIYLEVTRGAGAGRTHLYQKDLQPGVFAFAHAADLPAWRQKFPDGVNAVTLPDPRWQRCNIKTTMLLANTLARREAGEAGSFEAIFVGPDSTVRESSSANIFAVIDGVLRTHPADNLILPGITRQVILELARTERMTAVERAFTVHELTHAEEAFFTGTTSDVCPLTRVDDKSIGAGHIGPVTERLMLSMAKTLETETR